MDIGALGEWGESGLIPTPTEAAQMRQRHAARVQRPSGRDTDGQTAESPRTRSETDTLAHNGFTQRRHPHVAYAVPDGLEARNPGVLASGWSRLSALGPKAWEERETEEQEEEKRRAFCHRYVSAHFDASTLHYEYVDF